MRLSIFSTVSFAITSLVLVECNPISASVSASVSAYKAVGSSYKAQVMGPVPILLPQPSSAEPPNEPSPVLLTFASPQILDAPKIEPTPNEDSDPIVEVPIIEPISEPSEDVIYPQQPGPELSAEEIEDLKSIRNIANQIGECRTDSKNKCDIFKLAGGIVCSNTSAGVVCDNLNLTPCIDLVIDACYNFTDTTGVFCSEGGCAQYK